MLINDIVVSARRILGDTKAFRWTDERMLDIVNAGLRDINRHAGAFRKERFFELQPYRYRYPLPTDLLQLTSIYYNGENVPLVNQQDNIGTLAATKDQLNIGILEFRNLPPVSSRAKRLFGGPVGFTVPQPAFDLWSDGTWNNTSAWRADQLWGVQYVIGDDVYGVAANPLLNPLGVTNGAVLPASIFDNLKPKTAGLLSDVHTVGDPTVVKTSGSSFGVLTSFTSNVTADKLNNGGTIGTINNAPYRLAGRYGTVTSVLSKSEYMHLYYKAMPHILTSLEEAFPLSPSWVEPMVNWIVGTALQDDNDANNMQRAGLFLSRYERDLKVEIASSYTDYSSASKKYETKYNGGIV